MFQMMSRLVFILIALLLIGFSPQQQTESKEYELKAAFIYKFTNYIEWDSQTASDDFIIGILGNSPIENKLTEIGNTEKVNNKKIIIRKFNKLADISPCHILFISQKTSFSLEDILAKATSKGTLTVSEKRGYAAHGTNINFIIIDNKLKFEANLKTLSAAGLRVSSQLLKLAIIVDQKNDGI
jgi:hypothetical protein